MEDTTSVKPAGLIFQAIPKIMSDLKAVAKSRTNKSQGWNFRGIDDIYNAVQPIMAEHGVFTVPIILKDERIRLPKSVHAVIHYLFRFYASDGSFIDAHALGEGIDFSDKVSNKCASIAHKYAFLQVLAIPTEGIDDPDSESPEVDNQPEKPKVEASPQFTPSPAAIATAAAKARNKPAEAIKPKATGVPPVTVGEPRFEMPADLPKIQARLGSPFMVEPSDGAPYNVQLTPQQIEQVAKDLHGRPLNQREIAAAVNRLLSAVEG